MPEASLRDYVMGFVLALVLTAIPFGVVASGWLPTGATVAVIVIAALAQVVVHFRYFLHLGFNRASRDRLVTLVFAGLLLILMIGGTLWIMFDLNARMM